MNLVDDVVIGYTTKYKEKKKTRLEPQNFPSIIGGNPIWLIPRNIPDLKCDLCGKSLLFILQLYSPLNFEYTFHRSLYLFVCDNKECNKKQYFPIVYRCQLNEVNEFYIEKGDEYEFKGSNFDNNLEIKLLKNRYFIKTYTNDKETNIYQYKLAEDRINDLLDNPIDSDYEDFEVQELKKEDFSHEKELIDNYMKSNENGVDYDCENDFGDHRMIKIDKNFEKYNMILKLNNYREIIRFCRNTNTEPLWYSDNNIWNKNDIKKCDNCGGERIFEFQINNNFLNLSPELIDFDWGILAIYTCKNSCTNDKDYIQEIAMVQKGNEIIELKDINKNNIEGIEKEMKNLSVEEKKIKKNKKKKEKIQKIEEEQKVENEGDWE